MHNLQNSNKNEDNLAFHLINKTFSNETLYLCLLNHYIVIQIDKTIVSFDVLTTKFACDLSKCKGACCIQGDSGAPLELDEVETLREIFPKLEPYLRDKSIHAITKQGTSVIDSDGDIVTPLVEGKECAYVYFEDEIAKCAIEKAYFDGKIDFCKPISCHLYPVRISKYKNYEAINYHCWEICKPAVQNGTTKNIKTYNFLSGPLIRKYGNDWFNELKIAAELYEKEKINLKPEENNKFHF